MKTVYLPVRQSNKVTAHDLPNPAKNNLGLISKQILDRINSCIRSQINVNQWRNTHSIIDWFSAIKDKSQCTFLIFDIVDFYRSISEALLKLSLDIRWRG